MLFFTLKFSLYNAAASLFITNYCYVCEFYLHNFTSLSLLDRREIYSEKFLKECVGVARRRYRAYNYV